MLLAFGFLPPSQCLQMVGVQYAFLEVWGQEMGENEREEILESEILASRVNSSFVIWGTPT